MNDPINPSHYKHLPAEAIDIIMAAIAKAPSNKLACLHWQTLKYLLRCWEKKGIEDLRKAKWYLDRMVNEFDDLLAEASGANETPDDEPSQPAPDLSQMGIEVVSDFDKPKRYREPTLEDLKNGPIQCEVGDSHEKRTLIYVFPYGPGRARFAAVDETNLNCIGRWIDCRIEVAE